MPRKSELRPYDPPPPNLDRWVIDEQAIEALVKAYHQTLSIPRAFALVGIPRGVMYAWRAQAERAAREGASAYVGGFVGEVSMPLRLFTELEGAQAKDSAMLVSSIKHRAMPLYEERKCRGCDGTGISIAPQNAGRACKVCEGEGIKRSLVRDGDPKAAQFLLQVLNKGGEYDVQTVLVAEQAAPRPVLDVSKLTDEQLAIALGEGEADVNPGPNAPD